MDSLKIVILFSLLLLSSCAKVSYIFEQGLGQMSLLSRARWNDKVLEDEKVKSEDKRKIRQIEEYKKWFYEFWDRKETPIYSKTTFLKGEAVTWLVITSPFNKITALEECFPFMGCFPYLGFFDRESASSFAKDQQEEGHYTYMRPVYAYSTLGYFTDTILSSFFYYNEFDLAELIFHELFHTIFFIKDEVELNENLANYFGKKLLLEYFKGRNGEVEKFISMSRKNKELNLEVVSLASQLNERLVAENPKDKSESDRILDNFLNSRFKNRITSVCHELKITLDQCYPLKINWNNATFAAYLTYENKINKLERLRELKKLDLRAFFDYIQSKHDVFTKTSEKGDFSSYLFSELEVN